MNELIEALKDNEKPFGLMSEEMQAKMEEIGYEYCECYENTEKYEWGPLIQFNEYNFGQEYTYRLRPNYEENPEIVECEVKEKDGDLWAFTESGLPRVSIERALRKPDFIGFKYEDGTIDTHARIYKGIDGVNWTSCKTMDKLKNATVLTPTHVLFRSTT